MEWPRAIVHVDMDAFFVSVERKNDPSLVGRPVIVGGARDGTATRGVVAACSYETRPYGVRSAMPLAQALRLCPQAVLVPPGTSDYRAESRVVREAIESFTDRYEPTSIDEACIDLEGTAMLFGPPPVAADSIRAEIRRRTGLPVSVGLAGSKTVAKIASELAKPDGAFFVLPGGDAAILRPLALRALPGLGPKTAELLERRGLKTLGDLAATDDARLEDWLGEHGPALARRARGECRSPVEPSRERKSVGAEETFPSDVSDPETLRAELARLTMKVGARLRATERWASVATLKIRYPDFATATRRATLRPPTRSDAEILRVAETLLRGEWRPGTPLRLIGISVSGLVENVQDDLFSSEAARKRERLMDTLDAIREKQGGDAATWGAAFRGSRRKRPPGEGD